MRAFFLSYIWLEFATFLSIQRKRTNLEYKYIHFLRSDLEAREWIQRRSFQAQRLLAQRSYLLINDLPKYRGKSTSTAIFYTLITSRIVKVPLTAP